MSGERVSAPRGRHAPPLEVRLDQQRRRLFDAASRVFARAGYAEATAEAIAREAGMSKATFYEHFDNKEDCIIALFDQSSETVLTTMAGARESLAQMDPVDRIRGAIHALFAVLAANPQTAQTVVVEIIGAGPRAMERRDKALTQLADFVYDNNADDAATGQAPRFASRHDAFAYVGAVVELVSRHLRTGVPEDVHELEPVVERIIWGLLEMSAKSSQP
jgi:AcrR family transcriptional regulator